MKLKELLKGETLQAQQALDGFFSEITEEKILWYPSAGQDYRDLMEISPDRLALHEIPEQPNIICHTDYVHWTGLKGDTLEPLLVRNDGNTAVRIMEKHRLILVPDADINYRIRPGYVAFPDLGIHEPTVYLLKIKISSTTLGEIEATVFYFLFENYNFLEELVLKHQLAITHFVKVREGCGFGGCRKCISVFYSLLANVGVRYLLIDGEVHYCQATHDRLTRQFGIEHQNYQLVSIGISLKWSGFDVHAFKVEPLPSNLTNLTFNQNLALISEGWNRTAWQSQDFFS